MGQAVDVTLITVEDVPYPGIPTAEEQAADPSLKAYAEAVQPWMDENPGVKLEQITFDVYDQGAPGRHLWRHCAVVLSGGSSGGLGRRAGPGGREVWAGGRCDRPGCSAWT